MADHGVVASLGVGGGVVVGGPQAFLEAAQIALGILGKAAFGGVDQGAWRLVVHPGDRREGFTRCELLRFVDDAVAAFDVVHRVTDVGIGTGHSGDDVLCGVRIARGDDHLPAAVYHSIQPKKQFSIFLGGAPDLLQPVERFLDLLDFSDCDVIHAAGVAIGFPRPSLRIAELRKQSLALLVERSHIRHVPVQGRDAVGVADQLWEPGGHVRALGLGQR